MVPPISRYIFGCPRVPPPPSQTTRLLSTSMTSGADMVGPRLWAVADYVNDSYEGRRINGRMHSGKGTLKLDSSYFRSKRDSISCGQEGRIRLSGETRKLFCRFLRTRNRHPGGSPATRRLHFCDHQIHLARRQFSVALIDHCQETRIPIPRDAPKSVCAGDEAFS